MSSGPFPLEAITERPPEIDLESFFAPPVSPVGLELRKLRSGLRVLPSDAIGNDDTASDPIQWVQDHAPDRRYNCPNYDTCLGLAAALDWGSFTCGSCPGSVNAQLVWRAHQRLRKNPTLSRLCKLPVLSEEALVRGTDR